MLIWKLNLSKIEQKTLTSISDEMNALQKYRLPLG